MWLGDNGSTEDEPDLLLSDSDSGGIEIPDNLHMNLDWANPLAIHIVEGETPSLRPPRAIGRANSSDYLAGAWVGVVPARGLSTSHLSERANSSEQLAGDQGDLGSNASRFGSSTFSRSARRPRSRTARSSRRKQGKLPRIEGEYSGRRKGKSPREEDGGLGKSPRDFGEGESPRKKRELKDTAHTPPLPGLRTSGRHSKKAPRSARDMNVSQSLAHEIGISKWHPESSSTPEFWLSKREFTPIEIDCMIEKGSKDGHPFLLGRGSFGAAYRGEYIDKPVCVKFVRNIGQLEHDVKVHQQVPSHMNVIDYVGCCRESHERLDNSFAVVTELLGDAERKVTNVTELIQKIQLSEYERISLALDISRGLSWLHMACSPGICHHDLKSDNVFVIYQPGTGWTAKVGDLGLARCVNEEGVTFDEHAPQGTIITMAPEVINQEPHTLKADIYSFALVLYQLVNNNPTLHFIPDRKEWTSGTTLDVLSQQMSHMNIENAKADESEHAKFWRVFKEFRGAVNSGQRPPMTKLMKRSRFRKVSALIRECWSADPKDRPSSPDVVHRLTRILIDFAVPDPTGRHFWKTFFLREVTVPWESFAPKFYEFLGVSLPSIRAFGESAGGFSQFSLRDADVIRLRMSSSCDMNSSGEAEAWSRSRAGRERRRPAEVDMADGFTLEGLLSGTEVGVRRKQKRSSATELQYKCLFALCAQIGSLDLGGFNNVMLMCTLRSFGKMLSFYGPLAIGSAPHSNFLVRIRQLLEQPWFHGPSRTDMPADTPFGNFLVRESGYLESTFRFIIARNDGGKPDKYKILRDKKSGRYCASNNRALSFDTLKGFIDWVVVFYEEHKGEYQTNGIAFPPAQFPYSAGSPFKHIFGEGRDT